MEIPSFNALIQKSIVDHWDMDALTDYKGATLQYHDVARKIEKLHIMFENSGVVKGDKIALCGRNSANWAVAFLATLTYGAIAVPILHEFMPDQIHNIVNHSESKLLFVGDYIVKTIDEKEMPNLSGILNLPDFSLHTCRNEKLAYAREHLNELFGKKYPMAFRKEDIHWHVDSPEELCMLNYTSGTTGFSKGVMLPYRAVWGNVSFCMNALAPRLPKFSKILSILPMAHMYGQAIELLKTQKLRDMVIDIETDGSFDINRQEENILKVLSNINEMISQAFGIVSQQPALLPLYRQMIEAAAALLS